MNTIISPTSTASSTTLPIEKDSLLQTSRIEELDYLKCLFVLLMVAFHLAYFADGYPLLKQWVYTFHMPGFLLISGYLMRVALARLSIELHYPVLLLARARWHRPSHSIHLCRQVFRAPSRSLLVSTHPDSLRHRIFYHLATERM